MDERKFRAFINPVSVNEEPGKWDWRVIVQRISDGVSRYERVSGGWLAAEAVAEKLAVELGQQ